MTDHDAISSIHPGILCLDPGTRPQHQVQVERRERSPRVTGSGQARHLDDGSSTSLHGILMPAQVFFGEAGSIE